MKKIPNILTFIRILLVPIISVLLIISKNHFNLTLWIITTTLFIIASITDFLDGYIARKYNVTSKFGSFFDPIADKLLVNSVLIIFLYLNLLPIWITIILILRDIFIDFLRFVLASNNVVLSAGIFGKLKTTFQMIGLSLILIFYPLIDSNHNLYSLYYQLLLIPTYIAVFFSIYSAIDYFWKSRKLIL